MLLALPVVEVAPASPAHDPASAGVSGVAAAARCGRHGGRGWLAARLDEVQSRPALRASMRGLRAENSRLKQAEDQRVADLLNAENLSRLARRLLQRNVATINLVVIVTFGMGIAYSLPDRHPRRLRALLLRPGLRPGPSFARSAIALDLFLRLPGELLHINEALVRPVPIFYKACTSGVAYTFGDFISQIYQGRDLKTLDLARSFRSIGAAGFIGHGPLCHFWMLTMEQYFDFSGAWWGTGVKVLADQTVWSLYLNAMYSFLIGALAFHNPKDVWQDVKATSWPARCARRGASGRSSTASPSRTPCRSTSSCCGST